MKRPSSQFGVLFMGDEADRSTWSIADPTDERSLDGLKACRGEVFNHVRDPMEDPPESVTVQRDDLQRVVSLAEAYVFLGTYELGTKVVCQKLTDVRRVVAASVAGASKRKTYSFTCRHGVSWSEYCADCRAGDDALHAENADLRARLKAVRVLLLQMGEQGLAADDVDWTCIRATDLRVKAWRK